MTLVKVVFIAHVDVDMQRHTGQILQSVLYTHAPSRVNCVIKDYPVRMTTP